jgi:rhodanese-related sulfurtransferase
MPLMASIPTISVPDVPDDATVLDVREDDEWSAGHAPGAVHVPMSELPSRLADLPESDGSSLAVVCRSGGRSAQVVAWLTQQGYDVSNVAGGMQAWAAAGKPMVSERGTEPTVL